MYIVLVQFIYVKTITIILSCLLCSLKVIRFPLLKIENVIKIISRLKLPRK